MNKWVRRALLLVAVVLVGVGSFLLYVQVSGVPKYDVQVVDLHIQPTPARVVQGRKIASMLCEGCHLNQNTQALTGHRMYDANAFGTIYSRNITRDPNYGIGKWTDGDIARMLRTGIKPDGQYSLPYMPKLPHISDEDLASIISFLRSDDTLVRPMAVRDTDCQPNFFAKFLSHVAFKPFAYPTAVQTAPTLANKVEYGKYLVQNVNHCYQCHSASFATNDEDHPEASKGYMAGGNELVGVGGKKIYSTNLTMDPVTGIGKWSEADFIRALRQGFRPDNSALSYPMERLPELTEEEASAIYAYIKTIPVVQSERKVSEGYTLATNNVTAGQKVYYKYGCTACHASSGSGSCDLTHAQEHYKTNAELTARIRNASQFVPNSKMPTWDHIIQESEYEDLCNFVRLLGDKAHAGQPQSISMK